VPGTFNPIVEDISGLGAGDYYVTIGEADYRCQEVFGPFTVKQPAAALEITLDKTTNVTTAMGSDGTAFVSVTGGPNQIYTTKWYRVVKSPYSETHLPAYDGLYVVNTLGEGDYIVEVSDPPCLTRLQYPFHIYAPNSPFALEIHKTDISPCNGDSRGGKISLIANGGATPYKSI